MNHKVLRGLLAMVVTFCVVGQTSGNVISQAKEEIAYSNFGPRMAFDNSDTYGWTINGLVDPPRGQQAIAQKFVPVTTGLFSSAQVALTLYMGPDQIAIFLQEDSNGLPGSIIEQMNVAGLTHVPATFTATSILRPQLHAGRTYWLTVVAGGPGVLAAWNWNSIGDVSLEDNFAATLDGSPTGLWSLLSGNIRGAFQINSSLPTVVLSVNTLDTFDRANGRLRSQWVGNEGLGGYAIQNKQVDVLGGGPIYWNEKFFTSAQQAAVTLTQLDGQHREHGLILKAQGNPPNWRKGYMHVYYIANNKTVQVSAYQPDRGIWTDYAPLSVNFVNGDQLGAQAWPDGRVRIFRNDFLVGIVQLNAKDQAFYSTRGGRIGLWFNGYGAPMEAWFDNFGGGDINMPDVPLRSFNNASTEISPGTGKFDTPIITSYTERNYPRNEIFSERLYLPILLSNGE